MRGDAQAPLSAAGRLTSLWPSCGVVRQEALRYNPRCWPVRTQSSERQAGKDRVAPAQIVRDGAEQQGHSAADRDRISVAPRCNPERMAADTNQPSVAWQQARNKPTSGSILREPARRWIPIVSPSAIFRSISSYVGIALQVILMNRRRRACRVPSATTSFGSASCICNFNRYRPELQTRLRELLEMTIIMNTILF